MNDILKMALQMAQHGWAVFFCNEDKTPACPNGFKAATCDPDAVRELWNRYPGPLIAIGTGQKSGLAVLDDDSPRHPEAAVWLRDNAGRLPPTYTAETRSGGKHLYFLHRPGLQCSAGKIAHGIDVRADGGYVIYWPAAGFPIIAEGSLAPWPEFLDEALALPKEKRNGRVGSGKVVALAAGVLKAVDMAALTDIVRQLPNDSRFDDRTAWIRLAHAIAAAFCDDLSLGEALWLEHAAKREQKPGEPERVWATLSAQHYVGADWLISIAKTIGIDVSEYEAAKTQRSFQSAPIGNDATLSKESLAAKLAAKRLAALPMADYDKIRATEAKELGIRTATLDGMVKQEREIANPASNSTIELNTALPWPEPVALSDLLNDISTSLSRHIVLPGRAADVIALWIAHTWVYERFEHTPRLGITSPAPRCGKSTLLDVLRILCRRSLKADSLSASSVFRTVELLRPVTLLIDEADSFLPNNEELRGVLNSGYEMAGMVLRTVEIKRQLAPKRFATFAPVALATINTLPTTIADRAIPIKLKRKTSSEKVTKLRAAGARSNLRDLAGKLRRWSSDEAASLTSEPLTPEVLNDRAADISVPLLSIAAAAGDDWWRRGWSGIVEVFGQANALEGEAERGVALLGDIRAVFDASGDDRLPSAAICFKLMEIPDSPWPEFNRGKALSPTVLASLLKPFGVRSGSIRLPTGETPKGYYRSAFVDAWERYLPA